MQAIAAHIKACELAEQNPKTDVSSIPTQMLDPWWTELKLRSSINQVVVQENKYKEQMVSIFKEVEETDQQLTKTVKEVFAKLAKWRIRQLGSMQVHNLFFYFLFFVLFLFFFFLFLSYLLTHFLVAGGYKGC